MKARKSSPTLYPFLSSDVGAEGVNFVAIGGALLVVVVVGAWLYFAVQPPKAGQAAVNIRLTSTAHAQALVSTLVVPTEGFGAAVKLVASPTVASTEVGRWYQVEPSATAQPTNQYPDGWGMWSAERTLVPSPRDVVVCGVSPDGDPCADAWIAAGRADEYFERWTPTVAPSPTLPAFITYTPVPSRTPVYVSERWSNADR